MSQIHKICVVCRAECSNKPRFQDEQGDYFHEKCHHLAFVPSPNDPKRRPYDLGTCPYNFDVQRNITLLRFGEQMMLAARTGKLRSGTESNDNLGSAMLERIEDLAHKGQMVDFWFLENCLEGICEETDDVPDWFSFEQCKPTGSGLEKEDLSFNIRRERSEATARLGCFLIILVSMAVIMWLSGFRPKEVMQFCCLLSLGGLWCKVLDGGLGIVTVFLMGVPLVWLLGIGAGWFAAWGCLVLLTWLFMKALVAW